MNQDFPGTSPEYLISGHAIPPEMVRDLYRVSQLTEDQIRKIAGEIRDAPGLLTDDRVTEIVSKVVAAGDVTAVVRAIRSIPPGKETRFLQMVLQLRQNRADLFSEFKDEDFDSLGTNLGKLIQDVPSLRLMHKASRLLRDIGNELQSLLFVCDARPVYSADHTTVEGFITLVNLRMGVTKQNGDFDNFEIALTEDELEYLIDQGKDALQKLRVLQQMVGQGGGDTK